MTRVSAALQCNEPVCKAMTNIGADALKWKRDVKVTIIGAWTGDKIEVLNDYCPRHKKGK